jgi:hypothetical protein
MLFSVEISQLRESCTPSIIGKAMAFSNHIEGIACPFVQYTIFVAMFFLGRPSVE